jgi:hypothetical protein
MTKSDDPLRELLDRLAEELDRLSSYLDRIYEEMFIGTAEEPRISLLVDDVPWVRVPDFDRSGPDDRHYVLSVDDAGRATVRFGDGQHGQRPHSGSQLEVRYGRGSRALAVLVAPDRLTLTAPPRSPTTGKVYGIHRAVVVDAQDPQGLGRLQVRVPRVTGEASVWAVPCLLPSDTAALPAEGSAYWVLYEDGDMERPVWLGGPVPVE